jgi:hypothetical protein
MVVCLQQEYIDRAGRPWMHELRCEVAHRQTHTDTHRPHTDRTPTRSLAWTPSLPCSMENLFPPSRPSPRTRAEPSQRASWCKGKSAKEDDPRPILIDKDGGTKTQQSLWTVCLSGTFKLFGNKESMLSHWLTSSTKTQRPGLGFSRFLFPPYTLSIST